LGVFFFLFGTDEVAGGIEAVCMALREDLAFPASVRGQSGRAFWWLLLLRRSSFE
jgi:hypothetical protein